ncbi:MAG: hypothetical protein ACJAYG_002563, partial [Oceanicoccus sp.]
WLVGANKSKYDSGGHNVSPLIVVLPLV